jgi:hypothetical protein
MVDLGGYVIVLVEQNGKIKLYGKCNLFKFKNKTKLHYINVWEFDRIAETILYETRYNRENCVKRGD